MEKFYPLFCIEALKSPINNQLAAGILKEKKLVGKICCNTNRNFCRGIEFGSLHAEVHAILNYYGKNLVYDKAIKKWILNCKSKKLNLIVMRINKNNELCNARPCYNCLELMKTVKIKKIYYSTGIKNEIVCELVKYMVSIQSSSVMRLLTEKTTKKVIDDKNNYYKDLLIKFFPSEIKYESLICFINYSFKNIFPNYQINLDCGNVYIFDNKNKLIIKSKVFI
jgi:hypothetical protein